MGIRGRTVHPFVLRDPMCLARVIIPEELTGIRKNVARMAATCRLLGLWPDLPTSRCEILGRTHPLHRLTRSLPARLDRSLEDVGYAFATNLGGESELEWVVAASNCYLFGDPPSENVSDNDPSHASVRLPQRCDPTHPDTFNCCNGSLASGKNRREPKKSELSRSVSNTGCKWSAVVPERPAAAPRLDERKHLMKSSSSNKQTSGWASRTDCDKEALGTAGLSGSQSCPRQQPGRRPKPTSQHTFRPSAPISRLCLLSCAHHRCGSVVSSRQRPQIPWRTMPNIS